MKKFMLLIALLAVCGCNNYISIEEKGKADSNSIVIPDDQVLTAIESNIDESNSVVVIKWEKKEK